MSISSGATSVLRGLGFAACLAFGLGACAEPLQNGGVFVFGGADARFEAMCRFRRGADGQKASCVPATTDVAEVRVERIKSDSQLLAGPKATGAVGDLLITNGEISAIVGGPTSLHPGGIIDIVDAHVGQDELESFTPCVAFQGGDCLRIGVQSIVQEKDGSVRVDNQFVAPDGVKVVTRYTLIPGARSLHVSTIVQSSNPEPMSLSRLDDVVSWGSSQPMVPSGQTPSMIASVGSRVAYGLVPYGSHSSFDLETNDNLMTIRHVRDAFVSATQEVRRDRTFVVAPRGDSLGVLTEVAFTRQEQTPGAIELHLARPDGTLLKSTEGARVRLISNQFPIDGFWMLGLPEEGVPLAAEAPPGTYLLDYEGPGRHAVAQVPVTVRSGEIVQATIVLEDNAAPVPTP